MAYTPEQLNAYKTYISQNKSKLDTSKLKQLWKDTNAVKEFQESGSISKDYFAQPIQAETPVMQQPVQPQPPVGASPVSQPIEPKVETPKPIETPKAPKIETPKTTETPVLNPITKDTNWADVKEKNLSSLEQLVEARYGTVATQQDGKLVWQIDGKDYEWTFDAQGNPTKKEIANPQLEAQQSPEGIFTSLAQWVYVDKRLPWYKEASKRFNDLQKYSTYSQKEFESSLANGTLLPWTQTYNDLIKIPKVKEAIDKAQALNKINGVTSDLNTIYESQSEEIGNNVSVNVNGQTTTIKQALQDGYIDKTEYDSFTNTPEVIAKVNEVEQLTNKRDELQLSYNNVEDDVRKQLKGTGATESQILATAGMKQEDMIGNLNLAESKLQSAIGSLTELKKTNTELFAQNMDIYKQQEQRAYDEAQATKTLEQNYAYQYGDLNSENPTLQNIAIERAVAGMYENYPIPGLESQATKVQKVKNLIAQGMSGTEAIAQVESEIRNSQRYKDYIASEKDKLTSAEKPFVVSEWSSVYDPVSKTWSTAPTQKSAEVMQLQEWDVGGECGTFARQYTGISTWLDSIVWKTASDRRKTMTETQPVEWGLAFFEWGNYNKDYGHIEVVKSINEDGTMTLVWSNLYNDRKVTERTIPISEAKWFYNNTPLATGGESVTKNYTDTQKNIMSSIDIKNPTKVDEAILSKSGLTIEDAYNYKASLKQGKWSQWLDDTEYKRVNTVIDDLANDQVTKTFKKSQEAYNFATKVKAWDNATDNQALIYAFAKAMDPDSVVREWEYATVQKYSQVWWDKFGMNINRILNGQEFISKSAKENIVNTIKSKYDASKDSYDSLRNTKIKMINDIAGKEIWDKALPSDVMQLDSSTTPTQTTTPATVNYNWYSLPK